MKGFLARCWLQPQTSDDVSLSQESLRGSGERDGSVSQLSVVTKSKKVKWLPDCTPGSGSSASKPASCPRAWLLSRTPVVSNSLAAKTVSHVVAVGPSRRTASKGTVRDSLESPQASEALVPAANLLCGLAACASCVLKQNQRGCFLAVVLITWRVVTVRNGGLGRSG